MTFLRIVGLTAALALVATPVFAQQFAAGDISVEKPWARATPKGAAVGVGYMTIRNKGAVADRLTGGSADFANAVEVHEMSTKGGVMTMRPLVDGLEIPPNGAVTLAPSSYHLMFQGLKRQLAKGETVKATLTFQHAGDVPVEFAVGGLGAMGPAGANSPAAEPMKGMKMD
jgi:periplasmic copper chaperone A